MNTEKAKKYQNGKIYTIRSYQTAKFYIGSTTQDLSKRFYAHKEAFKHKDEKKNSTILTSFKILAYGDAYIELLENVCCKSKTELLKREGELIRENIDNVVNKDIPNGKTSLITEKENTITKCDWCDRKMKQKYYLSHLKSCYKTVVI